MAESKLQSEHLEWANLFVITNQNNVGYNSHYDIKNIFEKILL